MYGSLLDFLFIIEELESNISHLKSQNLINVTKLLIFENVNVLLKVFGFKYS